MEAPDGWTFEEDGKALPGGQPALRMLRCNTLFAAAEPRQLTAFFEFLDRRCHEFPSGGADSAPVLPRRRAHGQLSACRRCGAQRPHFC